MTTKEIAECLKTKYGLIAGELTLSKLQESMRMKDPDRCSPLQERNISVWDSYLLV